MTEEPVTTSVSAPPSTGIAALDSVLDLVAGLDERPLSEHPEVFESAHSELRRPLDQPPGDGGPSAPPG